MEVKEFIDTTADIFVQHLNPAGKMAPSGMQAAANAHDMDLASFRTVLDAALQASKAELKYQILYRHYKHPDESLADIAEALGLHESQVRRFIMEEV